MNWIEVSAAMVAAFVTTVVVIVACVLGAARLVFNFTPNELLAELRGYLQSDN